VDAGATAACTVVTSEVAFLPEKSKVPVRDSGRMTVAQRFIAG
jgi:hypothetical protein